MKNREAGLFHRSTSALISLLAIVAMMFITCTIKDDNGSLALTGPDHTPVDSSATPTATPVVTSYADSTHVGLGDTLLLYVQVHKSGTQNAVYPRVRVALAASPHGRITPDSQLTNMQGEAVFRFVDTSAGRVEIRFTCLKTTGILRTIDVTNTPSQIQKRLTVRPQRALLRADGKDSTLIEVTVLTPDNNPMAGQAVRFTSTAGIISSGPGDSLVSQSITNRDGVARIKLKSTNYNDTAFVTVMLSSDQNLRDQTKIVFQGVTIDLQMDSSNIRIQGTTGVKATLLNAAGEPIPYSPILFTLGRGSSSCLSVISMDSTTGADGVARAVLRGETTGKDSLIVLAAGAQAQARINVTNLVLLTSLDVTTLQARETKSTTLHAVFTSASGQAQAQKTVTVIRHFLTREGAAKTDTLAGVTDASGKSDFTIMALPYECIMRLEVIASSGTDVAASEETIKFITSRNMTILALPAVIQADGTSRSTITVIVKNEDNNPLVGEKIIFKTDAGMVTSSAVTDSNGRGVSYLISDRRNAIAHVTATLESQPGKTQTVNVEFSGVTLVLGANPPSISSSGRDTCYVVLSLNDAAKNPIAGEPVSFYRKHDATTIVWSDSVTSNRGEARCKIVGTGTGLDTILAEAAGASDSVEISYSSNKLIIDTLPGQSMIANGRDTTVITVTYKKGDNVTPIPSATVKVSVTLGSVNDTVFAKGYAITPDMNGRITFTMRNPSFANTARVFVTANSGAEITSAFKDLYFKSARIHHIDLTGTPEVIGTNGDRAKITAIAFDSSGNRVKGEAISFNLLRGPGGSEYLDPATCLTNDDGTAYTYLISGTVPSTYKATWVVAGDFSGNKSDTVRFTIAGPPHAITVRSNILEGINYKDGTFGLPCAAIVTDVNGNPVADGTEVTFSVKVSGYVAWKFTGRWLDQVEYNYCSFVIDTSFYVLPFEDFNDNFKCDPGEDRDGDGIANRGEDIDGDGKFITGPGYYDVNHNNKREYLPGDTVEPSRWPIRYDSLINRLCYIDFDGDNSRDTIEPLRDTTISESKYSDSLQNYRLTHHGKGFDIDVYPYNGVSDPNTTVSIKRTVQTQGGKAINVLLYGQSDATKVEVMIWAESQGVITNSPDKLILPIVK